MAIKIKKGVAAAFAVIALVLGTVLGGLAGCQMPDGLDMWPREGRVDSGEIYGDFTRSLAIEWSIDNGVSWEDAGPGRTMSSGATDIKVRGILTNAPAGFEQLQWSLAPYSPPGDGTNTIGGSSVKFNSTDWDPDGRHPPETEMALVTNLSGAGVIYVWNCDEAGNPSELSDFVGVTVF